MNTFGPIKSFIFRENKLFLRSVSSKSVPFQFVSFFVADWLRVAKKFALCKKNPVFHVWIVGQFAVDLSVQSFDFFFLGWGFARPNFCQAFCGSGLIPAGVVWNIRIIPKFHIWNIWITMQWDKVLVFHCFMNQDFLVDFFVENFLNVQYLIEILGK